MLEKYVAHFEKLNTDRIRTRWTLETTYRAPHKPLLLLSVIDQFANNVLPSNLVEPSDDLKEVFELYWGRIMSPDQKGNFVLPFFHLTGDGFWHLLPKHGQGVRINSTGRIRSLNILRSVSFGARLDDDLYHHFRNKPDRDTLRQVLVRTYFSPSAQKVFEE